MNRIFATHRALPFALLALAAFAVYLNALANGFALDDVYIVQTNPRVHDLTNWRAIWLTPYWPFFGPELGLYRPLSIFLYAVQWAVGGGAAWVFHLTNVLLHVGTTVLVFLLLRRLIEPAAAFVGALLFAVHPVHTEAVANVVGQAELVAAAALIGACVVHAGRTDPVAVSWPRRLVLLLLFTIGVLAKENAVILPGLLVLTDLTQRRVRLTLRGAAGYADAMLVPLLLLVSAFAFYLVIRYQVLGGTITGTDAGPMLPFLLGDYRVLNALRAFPEFLRLLVFPLDLASDYSPAMVLDVDSVTPMVGVGALLLTALTILALLTPRFPAVGFPAGWFLISIITVSNLFFPIGVLIAERTLYLPSVALSAAVAYAWHAAAPHASPAARRLVPVALLIVVGLMAVRTWVRNPVWDSTRAVHAAMVRDYPQSYRSQWLMATASWQAGRIELAHRHFELARRIYDRDSQLLTEYASFLTSLGRHDEALELLERAYDLHDYVPRTTLLLAYAYLNVGRFPEAAATAERATGIGVSRATTLPIQAYANEALGNADLGIAQWRAAARWENVRSWKTWSFLARALARNGYTAEALAAADSARRYAAADTAGVRITGDLPHVIRSGCYRDDSAAAATGETAEAAAEAAGGAGEANEPRACDPLSAWFTRATVVQNANGSQNATGSGRSEPAVRAPGAR